MTRRAVRTEPMPAASHELYEELKYAIQRTDDPSWVVPMLTAFLLEQIRALPATDQARIVGNLQKEFAKLAKGMAS